MLKCKASLKKKYANILKIKVLKTGTIIEANILPNVLCFFLRSLAISPAKNPAKAVFIKQQKMVATGDTEKKTSTVLGETKTITPEANPKKHPTNGPNKMAPIVIGIRDRLKFTPPGIIIEIH